MKLNRMALAALLVSATVFPIGLIASDRDWSNGEAPAARRVVFSATPFLPVETACDDLSCARGPRQAVIVGERYEDAEPIAAPGRYGLFDPPKGESYALIDRTLVRIDNSTDTVLSVLRTIDAPED